MGRSHIISRNAAQVLPSKLLREVQRFAEGTSLWIPVAIPRAQQRRARVLALRAEGAKIHEIAEIVGVTERHVKKILHRDRLEAEGLLYSSQRSPS